MRRKTKYTLRKDGTIEMVKTMPDGKRKHFYGHSDDEVESKYTEALNAIKNAPSCHTFEYFADKWWEAKEPEISPNTIYGYIALKNRAVDEFGEYSVDEITHQMVLTWLKRLAAKDYSQKVINNSKSVCKGILDLAFAEGEIAINPCVGLPTVKGKPKVKRKSAPPDDIKKIEDTKTEDLFATMSYFMEYTGCRRGEAAALQQKHIDLEKKQAYICQAVAYRYSRKPELKTPKSDAGTRHVDLYDNVIAILPQYDDPETYIFFPAGLPTKTQLEKGLRKYQDRNELESTAHNLRHTYASLGHSAGVDAKDMQHRLGHSTIALTQDVYTDLEEEHSDEVREQINKYIQEKRIK